MSTEAKRVDLRFGDFACSVRGFEDPVEPLARLLREFGTAVSERAPDLGPLFDEATLRRLESEFAGLSDGSAVSAVPGLVLTVRAPDTAAVEGEAGPEPSAEAPQAASTAAVSEADADDGPLPGRNGATEEAAEGNGLADEVTDPGAVDRDLRAALTAPVEEGETLSSGEAGEPENWSGPTEEASPDEPDPLAGPTSLFSEGDPATSAAAEEPAPPPREKPQATAEPEAAWRPEPANLFDPTAEEESVGDGRLNLFLEDAEQTGASQAGDGGEPAAPLGEAPAARAFFRGSEPAGHAPLRPVDGPEPRRAAVLSVADLAKKSGASTAQDLIAASAAWLVVVQGQHSFTRREVLEVFEQIPGDHPNSAEARIKGFGKLIRTGQVKLGADDRFRLSDAERDRFEMLLD